MSVVEVRDLRVSFRGGPPVVDGVSLSIEAGEVLALVGESGSGKSVTARSLLRLAGPGSRVEASALRVTGVDLSAAGTRELRRLRGGRAGLVAQDALVSLDPLRPVGREIADTLRLHTDLDRQQRERRVIEILERAGVPDAAVRAGQRAGELSGGLRQRALIAGAIAAGPPLLIADEPTTALDATVAAGVLDLFRELADAGSAVLLITHDLSVVERIADRVLVMRAGQVVEHGTPSEVIGSPREEYTRRLVQAVPTDRPRGTRLAPGAVPDPATPAGLGEAGDAAEAAREADPAPGRLPGAAAPVVLDAEHLRATFPVGAGRRHLAVDDVGLRLRAGQTLGIVGESGSGKTTLVRMLLGLQRPEAGTVELEGELFAPGPESLRAGRRARLGWIAQDALDSLDGRWTVGRTLADALTRGRTTRPAAVADEIRALLASVELEPGLQHRRPRSLSGGQRQRVAIARAIAQDPAVLIADEPVSSLDVSVQAEVLDLLDRLQRERGLAILLVSHDLGVIRHSSDEVLVLERGRVVESGPTEQIFRHPQHPATRALVAAAPRLRSRPA